MRPHTELFEVLGRCFDCFHWPGGISLLLTNPKAIAYAPAASFLRWTSANNQRTWSCTSPSPTTGRPFSTHCFVSLVTAVNARMVIGSATTCSTCCASSSPGRTRLAAMAHPTAVGNRFGRGTKRGIRRRIFDQLHERDLKWWPRCDNWIVKITTRHPRSLRPHHGAGAKDLA